MESEKKNVESRLLELSVEDCRHISAGKAGATLGSGGFSLDNDPDWGLPRAESGKN